MMFRAEALNNHVYCSSQSLAGQGEHFSDCNVDGKFFRAWKVATAVVDQLTPYQLQPEYRKEQWDAYVKREKTLFKDG